MDGMLSQEEINALLGASSAGNSTSGSDNTLTPEEKDAIGEISNICMGTAATTLYSLVNQKVLITTPFVEVKDWNTLMNQYSEPCVLIDILYKEGIDGSNLLLLKENDVKVITDLMMGGDGLNPQDELSELHFSAIGEAMNQMMGSSATSLSSLLKCKIDISPPEAKLVQLSEDFESTNAAGFMEKDFVQVTFRMTIGDLVDSEIMQLYPIEFAKTLYDRFSGGNDTPEEVPKTDATAAQPVTQHEQGQAMVQPTMNNQTMGQPMMNNPMMGQPMMMAQPEVNVQNVQFKSFTPSINPILQQENIDLIMDVPLEVSAVLGRTRKSIKDILEFAPGKIIELDKLAGEPIDIMVNQKLVAKGEVVVIEESFGIRITEIIKDKL
ncbi:MAG: flagellar motor switch phosphatase FliY [Lachnospiraceae bacterium]|nr:flagellar motor switch phosphatase FliY [Lachnospiraceae bacterium]